MRQLELPPMPRAEEAPPGAGAPPPEPERRQLTAELEAALLRQLRVEWATLNHALFRGKLRRPTLALSEAKSRLGEWRRTSRTLEISRLLVLSRGWGTVVEVLKHEMAHQWVHEVVGAVDEPAHGPAFAAACAERGIDARAAGLPSAAGAVHADRRLLERVAKLLALAESPNVHEAQAAMAAAQRLLLKYNLEQGAATAARGYAFAHLGRPTGRVSESERVLAHLLEDHFFVAAIWVPVWRPLEGKRGSVLEVCGTPENLELAEYVHGFLVHTAGRLWQEHRRARRLKQNRDRRAFVAGVMTGFKDKLDAQAVDHQKQGLVWVGDADLRGYFKRRHPRVRWLYHTSTKQKEAHADGREAGRKIVLHRGVGEGPSGGTGLLPGRS